MTRELRNINYTIKTTLFGDLFFIAAPEGGLRPNLKKILHNQRRIEVFFLSDG